LNTSQKNVSKGSGPNSQLAREQVINARGIQLRRQGCENARLPAQALLKVSALNPRDEDTWYELTRTHQLSPRGAHRLLRVARTLADLDEVPSVRDTHLLIAAQWRAAF